MHKHRVLFSNSFSGDVSIIDQDLGFDSICSNLLVSNWFCHFMNLLSDDDFYHNNEQDKRPETKSRSHHLLQHFELTTFRPFCYSVVLEFPTEI